MIGRAHEFLKIPALDAQIGTQLLIDLAMLQHLLVDLCALVFGKPQLLEHTRSAAIWTHTTATHHSLAWTLARTLTRTLPESLALTETSALPHRSHLTGTHPARTKTIGSGAHASPARSLRTHRSLPPAGSAVGSAVPWALPSLIGARTA